MGAAMVSQERPCGAASTSAPKSERRCRLSCFSTTRGTTTGSWRRLRFTASVRRLLVLVRDVRARRTRASRRVRQRAAIDDELVEGDRTAFRQTLRGTNTGAFASCPATGATVAFTGIIIERIANGCAQ